MAIIQDLVEVSPEGCGVDMWEMAPAGQQVRCVEPWTLDRSQLGHCVSVAGDDEVFPGKYSVHDFSAVIAEFSNGHCTHASIVSRVRHGARCDRSGNHRRCQTRMTVSPGRST